MQRCLRELWLLLALNNIHLNARHSSGKANRLADALSRYHLDDAHVAYLEHAIATLDLCQVFPEDSMFTFTVD